MSFQKAGIVGLGLIGGSLAKALRKYGGIKEIVAYGRHLEPLQEALRDGTVTHITTALDHSFAGCDIIFLCTPVDTLVAHAQALRPFMCRDCILTDVGSTKQNVYDALAGWEDVCFIGGHPMAGSEKTGYAAAVDTLFENAYYLLTPSPHTPVEKVSALREMLACIGAIPVILPPTAHDRAVAAVSHAPHVIASALVNTVRELDDADHILRTLAAGGFRDITRIASSSPDIWQAISFENQAEILKVLDVFEAQLRQFRERLQQCAPDETLRFFSDAKVYRDSFQNRTGYMKIWELFVDIPDRPGTIATVTTHLSLNGINIKNIGVVNNREFENGVLQIIVDSEAAREKSVTLLQGLNFMVHARR